MSIYTEKLESVNRDSSTPKEFTVDYLELANKYRNNGEFEKAKKVYLEIKKDDDDEYNISHANYYLGIIFAKEKSYDDAINYLSEVNKDYEDIYSNSQYLLGLLFYDKSNFNEAIKSFKEINKDKIKDIYYYRAQYTLGELFRDHLNDKEKSKKHFIESKKYFYYEAKKELFCMEFNDNEKVINDIYKSVVDILEILKVRSDESSHEKCVAHYTSPTVALSLLEKKDSYLRLNTAKNVNDPTEGKVLKEYLNIPSLSDSKQTLTLISCFTFNHDSLNQFRLYGKENNLEASGVSIVFNSDFFNNQEKRINFIGNIEEPFIEDNKSIEKLPLYRCIYIDPDPKCNYINIAQRGKITFYRDGNENDIEKYFNFIEEKRKSVIENINVILENIRKLSFIDDANKNEVINFLLLPITFLVKHAAFEDEQECRILYLTDLKDKRIKTEDNKLMYLDYRYKINNHVHKIYLSSGAYKYKDFFIRLLNNSQDVCLSKNPFRNKS